MPADEDDGSVPQDSGLLRRLHPEQIVADQNTGRSRPSSAAFRDPEMSVDAEPLLAANGLDWRFTLEGYAGYSLVRFRASAAREKGLAVIPRPLPQNPAHTLVKGRKTQSILSHLRDRSEWVHLNDDSDRQTSKT
jgi:hypothetical protein